MLTFRAVALRSEKYKVGIVLVLLCVEGLKRLSLCGISNAVVLTVLCVCVWVCCVCV